MANPNKVSFTDLPGEIRNRIYSYLLPNRPVLYAARFILPLWAQEERLVPLYEKGKIEDIDFRDDGEKCQLAILRTNRRIYEEASSLLYNRTMTYTITGNQTELISIEFLLLMPFVPSQKFRSIHIDLVRYSDHPREWGTDVVNIDPRAGRATPCGWNVIVLCRILTQNAGRNLPLPNVQINILDNPWSLIESRRPFEGQFLPTVDIARLLQPLEILGKVNNFKVTFSPMFQGHPHCEVPARHFEQIMMGEATTNSDQILLEELRQCAERIDKRYKGRSLLERIPRLEEAHKELDRRRSWQPWSAY
ncbi:MAG: hypothetical protein Q9190_002580 [Brigantiaea leucoxantha]